MDCDVAIIGGGPGGSTLGAYLKKFRPNLSVEIFEREIFPRDHVGESHLPGINWVLQEIGAWEKIEAANFPIKIGATYRWGSSDDLWDFHFLPGGHFAGGPRPAKYEGERQSTAWQVDRAVYDEILLDHAASLGCEVHQGTAVREVLVEADSVKGLRLADGRVVTAKYYADCSGHTGVMRRALGVGITEPSTLKNVAFWDYWQDADWAVNIGSGGTRIQIMSLGYGWIWFIPVSATRTSCGFVCPAEYYKSSGLRPEELYRKALAEEPRIAGLLKNATSEDRFMTTKDWSFVADRMTGPNWFLVGESAGFADPILSAGMALTHTSAREAAFTIFELEDGNPRAADLRRMYEEVTRRKVMRHIKFADYWYTANSHFSDLKEYTREIAREAGLDLSAADAFQWLGTGGFLEDNSGQPGFAFYSLTSLHQVVERMSGQPTPLKIEGCNGFILRVRDLEEIELPFYDQGHVYLHRAVRRGDKVLPLVGMTARVLEGIEASSRFDRIVNYVAASLARQGDVLDASNYLTLIQTLEGLARDGWIKPVKLAEGPPVQFRHKDLENYILTNHDASLPAESVAATIAQTA